MGGFPQKNHEFSIDTPFFSLYKKDVTVMSRFFNDMPLKEEVS
jgi:hypothetical protein